MKNKITFSTFINQFLNEYLESGSLKNFSVFVCRQDGHLIYNRDYMDMGVKHASIGALLGGVWQAATTLASFIPKDDSDDIFRLSFDTSNQGIYILPFRHDGDEYSLGLLYKDEINPGFLKSRLRDLLMKMNIGLQTTSFEKVNTNKDFLFKNITDEEMNEVFSISGENTCHS